MFIWLPFREQPRQIREIFGHNLIVTLAPDRFVDSDTNEGHRLQIVCPEDGP